MTTNRYAINPDAPEEGTDVTPEVLLQELLLGLITGADVVDHDEPEILLEAAESAARNIAGVDTFEDAGVMTMNAGLVVRLADGSELQVTIVRSR